MNDPGTAEGRALARLAAEYGADWDIAHDRDSGLWWAVAAGGGAKLAADTPEGLAGLLAEFAALGGSGPAG